MTPQARSGKTTTEENRTQCRAVLCRTQHKPATDAVARATGLRSTGTGGSAFAGPAGESVKGLRNAATDRETPCDPSPSEGQPGFARCSTSKLLGKLRPTERQLSATVLIDGVEIKATVDTGAPVSFISEELADGLQAAGEVLPTRREVRMADGRYDEVTSLKST